MNEDLADLLKTLTGARSLRAIATQAKLEPSTLSRQVNGDLPAETAIAIARAYGLSVVRTLVQLGYVTDAEAAEGTLEAALAQATDEQLAVEMLRRVQSGSAGDAITEPVTSDQIEKGRTRSVRGRSEDELREMDLSGYDLAAGNDETTDDETTTQP